MQLTSERPCTRRRSLLEKDVAPCKANAATAAELESFMLFLGQEAQERASAAMPEHRCTVSEEMTKDLQHS